MQLDRERAASYYARVDHDFSGSTDAPAANWRVAWTAYLDHKPEAVSLLEQHLARFPNSQFITDDLYWLGREAEKSGDVPRARAYYGKICDRFTQTYFGGLAAARLAALGDGPVTLIDALARILPPPPAMSIAATIPPEAAPRQARADALRSIAFDSSAELELRAAYATTGEPRLLLEAAQAAAKAGHYGPSMTTARQFIRALKRGDSKMFRSKSGLWRFRCPMKSRCARRRPMRPSIRCSLPGLIRQESAFETNAVSHANAYGLMQFLPKTARLLARQTRVGYSHVRLFDPEYNLRPRHGLFGEPAQDLGQLWKQRWPPITPERIAWARGKRGALSRSPRNSWIRFRSRKRANTCKSSCATRKFIGGSTEIPCAGRAVRAPRGEARVSATDETRTVNPESRHRSGEERALSAKAAQFTESVIREMTRLAITHQCDQSRAGFSGFRRARGNQGSGAQEAIAADINQYAITWGAKNFRNAIAEKFARCAGNFDRSGARNHRLLRFDGSDDVDDDGASSIPATKSSSSSRFMKIMAPTRLFPVPRRDS